MSDFQDLDYYELLGVPRSATQDEIKRAYRREMQKYHPDRFVNAAADQQAYAQQRSQRLTEAYAALSDFKTRSAYNARINTSRTSQRQPGQTPPANRDHQAELYDQAVAHLQAGHTLQAIGVLRQLQQINPFYRDSADLLAQAEARAHAGEQAKPTEDKRRKPLLIAGGIGGVALVGLAAWALAQRGALQNTPPQSAAVGAVATAPPAATLAATAEPPTALPSEAPTQQPTLEPTAAATEAPTVEPTQLPTAEPTQPPTPEPTLPPTATPIPEGRVLFADDFRSRGWANTTGRGWSVGYSGGRYRIGVDRYIGAIWSYRTLRVGDNSIAADMQVVRGEGGLLLSFANEDSYLAFVLNPGQTSYRLEQRRGNTVEILTGGQSDAIRAGGETNRILARTVGDTIQLEVNGQVIANVDVPNRPASSRVGLLAISGSGPAEAYFDNFEVRAVQ